MGGQVGERFDVVIAGGGNAAFCAAHAAREKAERVLILEKAPKEWAGGNSYFTAGAFRTTFGGLEDIEPLLDNPDQALLERTKLDPYTPEDFMADMVRVTEGECDRTLTGVLAQDAGKTIRWLREKGLRFRRRAGRRPLLPQLSRRQRPNGGLRLRTLGGQCRSGARRVPARGPARIEEFRLAIPQKIAQSGCFGYNTFRPRRAMPVGRRVGK
jgi:tricarballylate dehydrogenase